MAFYSKEYDIFLGVTESFCHLCQNKERLIPAHFVTRGQEVWLRKFCPDCGEAWAIISSDLAYFKKCNDYLKKPDLPECSLTPIKRGCPFDCGVCPQHQNHPCLALFNIIDECNMKCNICYHNSEPGSGNYRSMDEIKKMHETLLKVESAPDLIQVTGGEPSIHPDIIEILKYLKSGPVRHLMINTNGIRISQDEEFVRELKGIGKGFEVYLQFDSLEETALKRLRNANVKHIREKALAMLDKYNVSTTLVCVIEKGLNDDEIPELIEYATKWKCVRGIVFQPIQDVGRNMSAETCPPEKGGQGGFRITLSEIREKIISGGTKMGTKVSEKGGNSCENREPEGVVLSGTMNKESEIGARSSNFAEAPIFTDADMIPLPCDPHKICVGYALKSGGQILPVTGKIPREMITEQKGTIAFEQDRNFIKTVIDTVSLDTAFGENIVNKDSVKRKLFCCWPEFFAPDHMSYENVFRIVIMEFSDMYNFDSANIKRECNFMIEPDLAVPFSTYNIGLSRSCGK